MVTTKLTLGTGLGKTSFDVVHNLESFGFDIQAAFSFWRTHRRTLTVEMFCRFIRQRDPAFICIPAHELTKILEAC